MNIKIAPSLLSADFAQLGAEVKAITEAGADWIHFDVMDGHFVPNITMGPLILKALKPYSSLPFDAHLMISNPTQYIDAFIDAGANVVTIHQEASLHLHKDLSHIQKRGVLSGLSLNPGTSPSNITSTLDVIDVILIMSVNPGFGGQEFISSQLRKIETIAEIIIKENVNIDIQVDGGVTFGNARQILSAGATNLVAGTAIFGRGPLFYADSIQKLRMAHATF